MDIDKLTGMMFPDFVTCPMPWVDLFVRYEKQGFIFKYGQNERY